MASLKELREQAAEKLKEMKQLRDQYHAAKDSDKPAGELESAKKKFAEVRAKYDALMQQIDREKDAGDLDTFIADAEQRGGERGSLGREDFDGRKDQQDPEQRTTPNEEDYSIALHAWARRQFGLEINERHQQAIQRTGRRINASELFLRSYNTEQIEEIQDILRSVHPSMVRAKVKELERRAMTTSVGSSGGFAIPEGFVRRIESNMLAFGNVMQVAEIFRTNSGNDIPWPTDDDTSNEGELIGESATTDGSTEATLGSVKFGAYKSHSKMVKVPFELIEDWDAGVDFTSWLSAKLGERLGRHRNRLYTTGTGASQPRGIVTAATLGITAASPTAITGDEIIRLLASIDPAYRTAGFGVMMHDNIWTQVQLLKDSNGQYLHTPGLQEGAADRLRGWPVSINQHMDSALATANKLILAGLFSKYKIREVNLIRLKRLDERYADLDQVAFDALIRHDGDLLDAGTAPVKYLQAA